MIYLVSSLASKLTKTFDNYDEAVKCAEQLTKLFSVKFRITEHTDMYAINNNV